ncbi:SMI1/KNR4 family protein [Massilia violaceinigra]|uniref:SMI1/KNR4 family protein n=1 Tax=Massilia violaceinigra TaxID=2045208 RepID=A0ABY4AE84_9BURK|nr:SMI1/KNR4 family protein [Massilia violaceinigra]UOD33109.1 SMI1/KNR4 family protein [Massilia violaceinigra]
MNITRLNINIGGNTAPSFSGNEIVFDKIARLVGASLPEDYLTLIRTADGGHPELDTFFLNPETGDAFAVDSFYSFSNPSVENIKTAIDRWGRALGKRILPIGYDGGDNQFYLDLNDPSASVWIFLHDEGNARVKLANNLAQFIASLTIDPDAI